MLICGSPETVRQTLEYHQKDIGFNVLVAMMQIGSAPQTNAAEHAAVRGEGDAAVTGPGGGAEAGVRDGEVTCSSLLKMNRQGVAGG